MSQSLPMKPGIGYPPDGPVELQRKIVWNTYQIALLIAAGGGGGGIVWVSPPATSTSAGTAGQVAYDTDYFYVCVATNTWARTPLSEW